MWLHDVIAGGFHRKSFYLRYTNPERGSRDVGAPTNSSQPQRRTRAAIDYDGIGQFTLTVLLYI